MTARVAALFMSAVVGLLVMVGLALSTFGWIAAASYAAVVLVALGFVVRSARTLRLGRGKPADGSTCSCCTTTVFDPVEIR